MHFANLEKVIIYSRKLQEQFRFNTNKKQDIKLKKKQ